MARISCKLGTSPTQEFLVSDQADVGQAASVLTSDQQAALTPDVVRDDLIAGNDRFASGPLTVRDHRGHRAGLTAP